MQIVSIGDNLHEMSYRKTGCFMHIVSIETICMKYHILISGENGDNLHEMSYPVFWEK